MKKQSNKWTGMSLAKIFLLGSLIMPGAAVHAAMTEGLVGIKSEITDTMKPAEPVIVNATTLTGAAERVKAGEAFTVNYGVAGVTSLVAQDINVRYDAEAIEFIEARSLLAGVLLISTVNYEPGKLRLIMASEGLANAVNGNAALLELSFKAKQLKEDTAAAIEVAGAAFGNDRGVEAAGAASALTVQVTGGQPFIPGDVNQDGQVSVGDIAIMAYHFGKDSSSPNWAQIKHADLDGNGIIDLLDLAQAARKILK